MTDLRTEVFEAVKSVFPDVFELPGNSDLLLNQNGKQYTFDLPIYINSLAEYRAEGYIESAIAHFSYHILKDHKGEV